MNRLGGILMTTALLVLSLGVARAAEEREALRPVKVRGGPAIFHSIVERLDAGSRLSVLSDDKRWIKVRTPSGKEGYVSARVFTERPKPKGYSAVLEKRGLSGVTATVSTMATRGLTVGPGTSSGGLNSLVVDFLERVPFGPEEFADFSKDLSAGPICERLPGWMEELGEPLPGDPQRDEYERNLGMRLAGLVLAEAELVTDDKLDAYLNQVGMAVASASSRYDLQWRFVLYEQDKPEAFSAPGGFVFLSTGLLAKIQDEAELAGVLAHEVAHVVLGHGSAELARKLDSEEGNEGKRPASKTQKLDRLVRETHAMLRTAQTGRSEREADAHGATYAACAGYDPAGLARVYTRLGSFEAAGDDQPSLKQRLELIRKVAAEAGRDSGRKFPERYRQLVLAQVR